MANEGEGSAAGAISGMTGAVMGTMLPFSCMYGCATAMLWLMGGGLIGLIVATILRHHSK